MAEQLLSTIKNQNANTVQPVPQSPSFLSNGASNVGRGNSLATNGVTNPSISSTRPPMIQKGSAAWDANEKAKADVTAGFNAFKDSQAIQQPLGIDQAGKTVQLQNGQNYTMQGASQGTAQSSSNQANPKSVAPTPPVPTGDPRVDGINQANYNNHLNVYNQKIAQAAPDVARSAEEAQKQIQASTQQQGVASSIVAPSIPERSNFTTDVTGDQQYQKAVTDYVNTQNNSQNKGVDQLGNPLINTSPQTSPSSLPHPVTGQVSAFPKTTSDPNNPQGQVLDWEKLANGNYNDFLNNRISSYDSIINDMSQMAATQIGNSKAQTDAMIAQLNQQQQLYSMERDATVAQTDANARNLQTTASLTMQADQKANELTNKVTQARYDTQLAVATDNNSRYMGYLQGKFAAAGMLDSSAGLQLIGKYMTTSQMALTQLQTDADTAQQTYLNNNQTILNSYFKQSSEIENTRINSDNQITFQMADKIQAVQQNKLTSIATQNNTILATIKELSSTKLSVAQGVTKDVMSIAQQHLDQMKFSHQIAFDAASQNIQQKQLDLANAELDWKKRYEGFTANPAGLPNPYGVGNTGTANSVTYQGLGDIAAKYEGSGPGTISSGIGDAGGMSYGSYQLSRGNVSGFLNKSGYSNQFDGLKPGSAEFNTKWKEMAQDPAFAKAQNDYISETHYKPLVDKLTNQGIDLKGKGQAVQEMLFSTATQYGPNTNVVTQALKGKDINNMTDTQIINAVQDYKANTVQQYFGGSSKAVQSGVSNRIKNEKQDLINLTGDSNSNQPQQGANDWFSKATSFLTGKSNNQENQSDIWSKLPGGLKDLDAYHKTLISNIGDKAIASGDDKPTSGLGVLGDQALNAYIMAKTDGKGVVGADKRSAALAQTTEFNNSPGVQEFQSVKAAHDAIQGISDSPADQQVLSFNFAKALNPDSAKGLTVGAQDEVRKALQSSVQQWGINISKTFQNTGVLTAGDIKAIKDTINEQYQIRANNYKNLYNDAAGKIKAIDPRFGEKDIAGLLPDQSKSSSNSLETLAKQKGFDLTKARSDGYSDEEIASRLQKS